MPTVYFKGQALPTCHLVTLGERKIRWEEPSSGLTMDFTLNINKSVLDIRCDVNRFREDDFQRIYTRALDLVRASVNLTAFASGIGMFVILHTFIGTDGAAKAISMAEVSLAPLCTAFAVNSSDQSTKTAFDDVYKFVITEPALFMALDDLIVSITLPHHSAVNCGRALDGLRKLIAPGVETKQSWNVFRSNLRLGKKYLDLITDTSTAPRHGDRSHIPGSVIEEIIRRSWVTMNRFIEFRKRGNHPLPENEFRVL